MPSSARCCTRRPPAPMTTSELCAGARPAWFEAGIDQTTREIPPCSAARRRLSHPPHGCTRGTRLDNSSPAGAWRDAAQRTLPPRGQTWQGGAELSLLPAARSVCADSLTDTANPARAPWLLLEAQRPPPAGPLVNNAAVPARPHRAGSGSRWRTCTRRGSSCCGSPRSCSGTPRPRRCCRAWRQGRCSTRRASTRRCCRRRRTSSTARMCTARWAPRPCSTCRRRSTCSAQVSARAWRGMRLTLAYASRRAAQPGGWGHCARGAAGVGQAGAAAPPLCRLGWAGVVRAQGKRLEGGRGAAQRAEMWKG